MMECFAQRYCQNNPDIFTNTDTCYVLSFAIIMLNTSLHNPSVKVSDQHGYICCGAILNYEKPGGLNAFENTSDPGNQNI